MHAKAKDGKFRATQLKNNRWVVGAAYGTCSYCRSGSGPYFNTHAVDASEKTYASASAALRAARRLYNRS